MGKPRDGGVALSVSVCKRVNIFQYWWNLSVCFSRDTGRLSLKCTTHKEQQREHKHTFTSKKTIQNAGRSDSLDVDHRLGQTTCAQGPTVLVFVYVSGASVGLNEACVCFWEHLMGRSILDMGGCQSYNSSDEEDVSALKTNYTNISLFKV